MSQEHDYDVIVVGAGISGINAAYRLQETDPDLSYVVLEGRDSIGGTWDLFKYPGLRSDSDMYTLGFPFEPWTGEKSIADGADILAYVKSTAAKYGIDQRIRLGHKVTHFSWDADEQLWTVTADTASGERALRARFVYLAAGYYSYDTPYRPTFAGESTFRGHVLHPQFWPEDLDYSGKRVVVIGSGATAVTLVPALVRGGAEHVTMLQRTPSYFLALPDKDPAAGALARILPTERAYAITRWRNAVQTVGFYQFAQRMPNLATKVLRGGARRAIGAEAYDERDFTPPYQPWDQRLCIVPNGDFFAAVRSGDAAVVTDTIEEFVPEGVRTSDGRVIEADIVVTATGLNLQLVGGAAFDVAGQRVDLSSHYVYRGCMVEGIPNAAMAVGYTNASWTLRSDLSARFFSRVVHHARQNGFAAFVPRVRGKRMPARPLLDLASGYIQRKAAELPKRGDRAPWSVRQNFLLDALEMRRARVDEELDYVRPGERPAVGSGTAGQQPLSVG